MPLARFVSRFPATLPHGRTRCESRTSGRCRRCYLLRRRARHTADGRSPRLPGRRHQQHRHAERRHARLPARGAPRRRALLRRRRPARRTALACRRHSGRHGAGQGHRSGIVELPAEGAHRRGRHALLLRQRRHQRPRALEVRRHPRRQLASPVAATAQVAESGTPSPQWTRPDRSAHQRHPLGL